MPATVLIADGDPTSLELITAVLVRYGYEVHATPDGGDALSRFLEHEPALVVCDEDVPVLGGNGLCVEVKTKRAGTRVVLLPARERSEKEREALIAKIGFDAILDRPFRFLDLRALLEKWELSPRSAEGTPEEPLQFGVPVQELEVPKPVAPPAVVSAKLAAGSGQGAMADVPPMPVPIPLPIAGNGAAVVPGPRPTKAAGLVPPSAAAETLPPPPAVAAEAEVEAPRDTIAVAQEPAPADQQEAPFELDDLLSEAPPEGEQAEAVPEAEAVSEAEVAWVEEPMPEEALIEEPMPEDALIEEPMPEEALIEEPMPEDAPIELLELEPEPAPEGGPQVAAAQPAVPSTVPARGDLTQLPLPRLVFQLYMETFTGMLHLARSGVRRVIHFRGGLPVQVDSAQLSENLGRMLVEHGRITEDQYEKAQALIQSTGLRQGEALLKTGAISEADLLHALHEQTALKLVSSFAWRDGEYAVEPKDHVEQTGMISEVNPLGAIWRGIQEFYDLESLMVFFSQLADRYVVATDLFPVHYVTLGTHLRALKSTDFLDGKTTFGQAVMSEQDPTRRMRIVQALYVLLVTDMVRPSTEPGEPARVPTIPVSPQPPSASQAEIKATSDLVAREYMRLETADHFEALGIDPSASPEDVDAAYARARGPFDLDALPTGLSDVVRKRAKEIQRILARAHAVLSDPQQRSAYVQAAQPAVAEEPVLHLAEVVEEQPAPVGMAIAAERLHAEGKVLMQQGDYTGAREKFIQAVEQDDDEPTYRLALGQAVLAEQEGGEAVARERAVILFAQALQLDPSHVEANLDLARLLQEMGYVDRAKACVDRVLRRAPQHQVAQAMMAHLDAMD